MPEFKQFDIAQGEDKLVPLHVFDTDTNIPLDCSTAQNIMAVVYVNNKEAQRFYLNPSTPNNPAEGTLTVDNNYKNVVNLLLERVHTQNFEKGLISASLLVQFTEPVMPFGYKHKELTYQIGKIILGKLKSEQII